MAVECGVIGVRSGASSCIAVRSNTPLVSCSSLARTSRCANTRPSIQAGNSGGNWPRRGSIIKFLRATSRFPSPSCAVASQIRARVLRSSRCSASVAKFAASANHPARRHVTASFSRRSTARLCRSAEESLRHLSQDRQANMDQYCMYAIVNCSLVYSSLAALRWSEPYALYTFLSCAWCWFSRICERSYIVSVISFGASKKGRTDRTRLDNRVDPLASLLVCTTCRTHCEQQQNENIRGTWSAQRTRGTLWGD